jgi:IclR family transcriptional regulator, KDG regulon repressor
MLETKDLVQSVDRAMVLLERLCQSNAGLSLHELADAAGLPKSTAHRLLKTLMHHNLVRQDNQKGLYVPGLRLFELAYAQINSLSLLTQASPFVIALARQTNETVHLAILDEYEVVYISKEETVHPIRMHSSIGKRAPAHCTGLGKAMLAYLPDEKLEEVARHRGLASYTPRTISSFPELKEHLSTVRRVGYAIDNAEHEEDILCVAAPIRDHLGEVIAAISLSAPAVRCDLSRIRSFAPLVCHYAEQISCQLGFVPENGRLADLLIESGDLDRQG